ncbi:hypothetical protein [Streptomyces albipurpureus]|uniref:DNA-binding protein n=1 Tax=Streptomyces albipurpureus TaxID=2897419 RepID=A0ABT0UVN0_9ACTN|nr:hypothetical protein [Streptomyces sp. CWNU-1]MCM2392520.1 hypothetical protein [Streptomyces sp. CWNU-1]
MKTYVLKFEAPLPSDMSASESTFYDHFDGLLAESFGRLLLTVYMEGHPNGAMAAKCAAFEIEKHLNVMVTRIDRDLVDAAEIARRIDRSRESVRQLVQGERRKGQPFPTPIGSPNGKKIWEWAAVNEWLRHNVPEVADLEFGLSRDEMVIVDNWLLRWGNLSREQHVGLEFYEITAPVGLQSELHARSGRVTKAWVNSWNRGSQVVRSGPLSTTQSH